LGGENNEYINTEAKASLWNSLSPEIRSLPRDLSTSFYKLLKTFIFARAWAGSASE